MRFALRWPWRALLAGVALVLAACGQDEKPAPGAGSSTAAPAPGVPTPAPGGSPAMATGGSGNAAKGQQVWMANCVACHNPDPAMDGSLGPAVKGASRALLEARVLQGDYPPDYKPKRPTKVMPPRPDLAPAISDLAAYLR